MKGVLKLDRLPRVGADLNQDHRKRDGILQIEPSAYSGGIARFNGLAVDALRRLVLADFIDRHARHNRSPTAGDFLAFMERWPQIRAHGLAVAPTQHDYRVSIEGIECELHLVPYQEREALREEFDWLCGDADEYHNEVDYLYGWWG